MTSIESGKITSVIYTDLSKAFDKVSHKKLIEILASYGVAGNVKNWITSFLNERKQKVTINGNISTSLNVLSGVPQGSVLAPLLFLIYFDDSTKVCNSKTSICLFADDAKLFSTEPEDLQASLSQLAFFLENRQLKLAIEKCEHITIHKFRANANFSIGDTDVHEVSLVRDLGVYISSDLKWETHINKIKAKAHQRSYLILKSFQTKDVWLLLRAYITYVRPIVEYATVIWNPYLNKDIESIEQIQRSYTKKICSRCKIPFNTYKDRLYMLSIRSLQYRRLEADLIMTFKILHKLVDIPFEKFFTLYSSPHNTRRHDYCLKQKTVKTNFLKNTFANRVVPTWNQLPNNVVASTTLFSFRTALRNFDLYSISEILY